MILAKNNLIVKIENAKKPEFAILNPVSGSFDLIDGNEYEMLLKAGEGKEIDRGFSEALLERGYAFHTREDQEEAINRAYDEFGREIAASQVQLMLVPSYGCNLACTYCFQHGIDGRPSLISKDAVDAFFNYAAKNFSNAAQKPFITLFGGEPLVNSKAQREIIEYIVEKCIENDYELAAVTNAYDLTEYIDLLKKVKVKEIQVTLDGSEKVHDARRAAANKKGTFARIIDGVDAAVKAGMPINLRSVVDLENIGDLVNLAAFLDSKGWLDLPPELFKTQIGRNYELFECYTKPQHLMTQVELWAQFAAQSRKHPVLAKFHRPDFKGIRHLVDTGGMYMASFDTCPACKTEWVFDLYGNIYGCTASCGREEYLLGTYWPEVSVNGNAVADWKKRDVKSIPECRDCRYDVICGGGCGVVAANRNGGNILSPDCRPIQELIELGVNHYLPEIRKLAGDEPEEKSCCCGTAKTEGCIICGSGLVYSKNTPSYETCSICGRNLETYVRCVSGHFVCDTCHSADILGRVEQLLANSNEKDPIVLAQKVFSLPGLNMHGPEYHSIVPAILVAAVQNIKGEYAPSKITEAIRRGRNIKGGSCGFNGCCGAGTGSGTALSVIEDVTPMSKGGRGSANRATGNALLEISKHEGPRCCKRETITSIESFMKTSGYFSGMQITRHICKQYSKNKDCIGRKCPYFPAAK